MNGLFRVLYISSESDVYNLGTAFAIGRERDKYYLLTAYHVISELKAKNKKILVEDMHQHKFNSVCIFPQELSNIYRQYGSDYALLTIDCEYDYDILPVFDCDKICECSVRGAVQHYKSIFSTFTGRILHKEYIDNQSKVLQIDLDTKTVFDASGKPIPEKQIIKGISGAPVTINIEDKDVCVGVLGNIERDSVGSKKYAVPVETIINECFLIYNIPYEEILIDRKDTELSYESILIDSWVEDKDEFIFSEELLDANLWDKLSNLFYKGIKVDRCIYEAIENNIIKRGELKCALLYYYARFLLKRGNNKLALEVFNSILSEIKYISSASQEKLTLLITSRFIIEKPIQDPAYTLYSLRNISDKINMLRNTSNEYIANEIASVYGRGLTNYFAEKPQYTKQEYDDVKNIISEHEILLINNPQNLKKQDVVNTSLKWYVCLWNLGGKGDLQKLKNIIEKGFEQSKERKNNIFHIQCLIACGMFCLLDNEVIKAIYFLMLSIKLMKAKSIKLNHEGIRQLILILKNRFYSIYGAIYIYYCNDNEESFITKVSMCQISSSIRPWNRMVDNVNWIYNILYNNKESYKVNLNELNNLIDSL